MIKLKQEYGIWYDEIWNRKEQCCQITLIDDLLSHSVYTMITRALVDNLLLIHYD